MSKPYYNIGGTSQSEFIIRVGSDGIAKLRYVHDGVDEADLVFAAPDATSDKELQVFGGAWVTDFDDSDPIRGVRLGGAYLALESTDISMQLHSAQVGCRVVVAGLTERGNALLAVEAPPTPDYIANVTNSADVTIYSGGTLPSAWVNVCDLLTITQDIDADEATVFFELLVENTGTKDGVFEIGISLNGAAPTAANSIQYLLSAGIQQIFANTSINAAFLANGTTARLQARGISAQAVGFSVVARNATRSSRLKVSVVGTGGGAIGANPTGTVGLTAVNGTALTWIRSDAAPPLSQAIAPTWSALHTFSLTPVVPNDSWTYAKIQNVSATSRVLGRITSGAGDIEELTGANLTSIIGGAALTKTDDTNVTLTLGGTPTTALLAATSLTLGWTGTLGVARGGTNLASYAVGDLLYASGATTLAKLADIATGNALISGGVTTAPSWGKIGLTTHVSGTLPAGNGGTGVASLGNLTRVDDTNVTMTLGGTPTGALITSASMTLGWTGTLAVARGGSGAATLTGYLKGNGTSAFTAVATIPYADITGGPAAANPSGLIGLSVVNGSALTWTRSDGTHALDQGIAPTWTAAHIFNGSVDLAGVLKASGSEGAVGQMLASQGTGLPAVWRSAGGGSIDMVFKFNTSTAGGDPGNQAFNLNSATYSAVTSIGFDILTVANFDSSTILGLLKLGNRIYIQQINDANRAAVFEVTAPATNNTGWWSVPVAFVNTTLAGTIYQSNANCQCVFILSTSNPGGANPTASVGLTAVNGTGTNFIRSDGAPALDVTIAPTWSGIHSFTASTTRFGTTASLSVGNSSLVQQFGITAQTSGHSIVRGAADANGPRLGLGKTRSTSYDATVAVQSGDQLGLVAFFGADATTLNTLAAQIVGMCSGTVSTGIVPGEIRFSTMTAAGALTEDFRMSSFGGLGVAGANYGTAGQVLTSGGSAAAASWSNPALVAANFANPSATLGLTAVNGSAITAMRSDGAPALSQAIVPTWSAQHIFSKTGHANASAIRLVSNDPAISFSDSDNGTGAKEWELISNGTSLQLGLTDDAFANFRSGITLTRSGAAFSTIQFGNATDNNTTTFLGTGLVAVNGQLSVGDGAAATGDRLRLRNSSAVAVSTNYHHYFNIASGTQLFLYAWDGASTNIGSFHIGHVQVFFADGSVTNPVVAFNSDTNNGLYFIGTDNWGASAGGAKVMEWLAAASGAAKVADTGGTMQLVGFRPLPVSSTTTTLAIGDVGKCIPLAADINIPISVFAAGDIVSVYNDSGSATRSITITAGGTVRKSGTTTTGPLTLAVRGFATLWFRSGGATPEVICIGDV